MHVGLRLSYRPSDVGRAALRLAETLTGMGVAVSLFSTDRIQPFHPRWDREVRSGRSADYRDWLEGADTVIHFSPCSLQECLDDPGFSSKEISHVSVVSKLPLPTHCRVSDRIVFHYASYKKYLNSGYPPTKRIGWGWDDCPIGVPLENWTAGRVLYPLHGGQAASAGPGILLQIHKLLEAREGYSVELWYGGGWDSMGAKYLKRLKALYPKRFEVLRDEDLPVGGVGDRYRQASLVAWPVMTDTFGEVPAFAEMAGTPIMTYACEELPLVPRDLGGWCLDSKSQDDDAFGLALLVALRSTPVFTCSREDLARRAMRRASAFEAGWRDLLADL